MTDAGEPLRSRRRRSFWVGMVGLAALVFVGIAAVLEMAPTAPTGPGAARGLQCHPCDDPPIADEPRPVGSAQHAEARAYLLDELGSLGWRIEVQESVGMFDFGLDGTQPIAAIANVIATRPGTASTGTVLLTAHYDTVVGSPGAADDGVGVGVLLETARVLSTAGAPRNTVMVLLSPTPRRLGCSARRRSRGSGRRDLGPPSCSTTRHAAPAAPR